MRCRGRTLGAPTCAPQLDRNGDKLAGRAQAEPTARQNYGEVIVSYADARHLRLNKTFNLIMCTGGLHHLTLSDQEAFLDKLQSECAPHTTLLIGEEVIESYDNEQSRRLACLRLGHAFIEYGVSFNWPVDQIEVAVEVLKNDLFYRGEYKRGLADWEGMLRKRFTISEPYWAWDAGHGGGDVVFICHKK